MKPPFDYKFTWSVLSWWEKAIIAALLALALYGALCLPPRWF